MKKKKLTFYIDEDLEMKFTVLLYKLHEELKEKISKSEMIEALIRRFVEDNGE